MPKLPVSLFAGFCLFALAAFAGGAALFIGYNVALKNTRELLYGNASLSIAALKQGVEGHLDPIGPAVDDLAAILERDTRLADDDTSLETLLHAAIAGLPQVSGLAVVDRDYRVFRVIRDPDRAHPKWSDWGTDKTFRQTVDRAMAIGKGHWGAPFYAESAGLTLLNYYRPLAPGPGRTIAIAAAIRLDHLSDLMIALSDQPQPGGRLLPFVLYGRDRVLAHPLFLPGYPGLTDQQPLPRLADFPDPVLAGLWRRDLASASAPGSDLLRDAQLHVINMGGKRYAALYTELTGYGGQPLLLGAYVPESEVRLQLDRLAILPQVAAGLLAVVLVLALAIGRLVSRPARQLAAAADHLRRLDLEATPRIEDTLLRELSAAAGAFNAMTGALRLFSAYVPARLVHRLLQLGPEKSVAPGLRRVTVMFTDIAGFSTISESLTADATARLLNDHFAILGHNVETEEGTIDKYIGDALMAFWGAPEEQPDGALRACRAALAIIGEIAADNARRRQSGEPPVRVRIGIHSGTAVVGDIGFPGRINYTIVGDTVNVCQRLEALAAEFDDGRDVTVLVSADTAAEAGAAFRFTPCGRRLVKGRKAEVEFFRLEP